MLKIYEKYRNSSLHSMHHVMLFICFLLGFVSCSNPRDRAQTIEFPSSPVENTVENASEDSLFELTDWIPKEWWMIFEDEQLGGFIQQALEKNPNIQAAHAQILAAEATAQKIRAALFPNLYWNGDATRFKISKTGVISLFQGGAATSTQTNLGGSSGIIPLYFTQYETALNLSFDFDIWKKNRNNLRSAIGKVRAQVAEEAFTRLALSIAVANVYFQLQVDYEREANGLEIVRNRQDYVDFIQLRLMNNVDNIINLNRAKSDLRAAEQQLLQIQNNLTVNENQLKAYLATYFNETVVPVEIARKPIPKVPLPREIPCRLIAHRPDIMAQLWIIQSAGRQIEVSKAGFYPDVNLMGFLGFQTIHFREWFEAQSSYYAVGPAFNLPIFDGGVLSANLRGSEVNYDLAIYKYNDLVLNAVKEVLDGIVVLQNTHSQLEKYREETSFEYQNFNLINERKKFHLDSQLDVLNAERNFLNYRDQEIVALGNTMQAILSLIKALGGGYVSSDVEVEG